MAFRCCRSIWMFQILTGLVVNHVFPPASSSSSGPPPASHTTCPHTTYSHTTCPHTTYSHTHTTCPHTTCPHTTYSHTAGLFARQVWHLVTATFTLRGRRGTYGTGLALVAGLGLAGAAAVCVAGVALGDIDVHSA